MVFCFDMLLDYPPWFECLSEYPCLCDIGKGLFVLANLWLDKVMF